jgi:hypothetical protein
MAAEPQQNSQSELFDGKLIETPLPPGVFPIKEDNRFFEMHGIKACLASY